MAVEIRPATVDDVDGIVEMARKFYETTDYASLCPMEDIQAAGLACLLIDSGVMIVVERDGELIGMAGLHIEPFTFNPTITMATELVYWLNPEARGGMIAAHLLEAITEECKASGCDVIRMMTLRTSPPQAAALYDRYGYTPSENVFTKRLH